MPARNPQRSQKFLRLALESTGPFVPLVTTTGYDRSASVATPTTVQTQGADGLESDVTQGTPDADTITVSGPGRRFTKGMNLYRANVGKTMYLKVRFEGKNLFSRADGVAADEINGVAAAVGEYSGDGDYQQLAFAGAPLGATPDDYLGEDVWILGRAAATQTFPAGSVVRLVEKVGSVWVVEKLRSGNNMIDLGGADNYAYSVFQPVEEQIIRVTVGSNLGESWTVPDAVENSLAFTVEDDLSGKFFHPTLNPTTEIPETAFA